MPLIVIWLMVFRYYLGLKTLPATNLRIHQQTLHGLWSRPVDVKVVVVLRQNLSKVGALDFGLGFSPFALALDFVTLNLTSMLIITFGL